MSDHSKEHLSDLPDNKIVEIIKETLPPHDYQRYIDHYKSCPKCRQFIEDAQERLMGKELETKAQEADDYFGAITRVIGTKFKEPITPVDPERKQRVWKNIKNKLGYPSDMLDEEDSTG